jgi:hypothetical protein
MDIDMVRGTAVQITNGFEDARDRTRAFPECHRESENRPHSGEVNNEGDWDADSLKRPCKN